MAIEPERYHFSVQQPALHQRVYHCPIPLTRGETVTITKTTDWDDETETQDLTTFGLALASDLMEEAGLDDLVMQGTQLVVNKLESSAWDEPDQLDNTVAAVLIQTTVWLTTSHLRAVAELLEETISVDVIFTFDGDAASDQPAIPGQRTPFQLTLVSRINITEEDGPDETEPDSDGNLAA